MTDLASSWLVSGAALSGLGRLLMSLPLCLSIAVVYKTTRCDNLREMPVAALVLWVTIVLGMYAVGIGMWALFRLMA